METRLASAVDVPALAALHHESFGDNLAGTRWDAAQIAQSLALDTTYAILATEADAVQGFLLCQIAADEAEILTFCTAIASRRLGLGSLLLEKTIGAAKHKGAKRLFLEVAADNKAALALYEKAGFRVAGRRPGYYRRGAQTADAKILELRLD